MSEEQVEAIFQHACEGAAESIGSTRVDWQRVVDAIRFLRRELEAAKQWGADLSNELTHRTTKLAEARLWLDSSESALQEAQRALFRWLPNRIGSEYEDLIAADAMALMGLESTEGLREVGNEILVELLEKRRLLDDARAQKPAAFETRWAGQGGPYAWGSGFLHKVFPDSVTEGTEIRPLYAAPVPAQPAAVPEAVAKASKLLRAHNEWRRGADNTAAYTAAGLGNAIDTVCDHIEEALGMVSTQIIPADVMNDAARYQWLKHRSPFGNRAPHIEQYPFHSGYDKVKLPHFTVVGLDDAIDAAIDAALLSAADTEVKK